MNATIRSTISIIAIIILVATSLIIPGTPGAMAHANPQSLHMGEVGVESESAWINATVSQHMTQYPADVHWDLSVYENRPDHVPYYVTMTWWDDHPDYSHNESYNNLDILEDHGYDWDDTVWFDYTEEHAPGYFPIEFTVYAKIEIWYHVERTGNPFRTWTNSTSVTSWPVEEPPPQPQEGIYVGEGSAINAPMFADVIAISEFVPILQYRETIYMNFSVFEIRDTHKVYFLTFRIKDNHEHLHSDSEMVTVPKNTLIDYYGAVNITYDIGDADPGTTMYTVTLQIIYHDYHMIQMPFTIAEESFQLTLPPE